MRKVDDRFIETTYANNNSLTADDVPYDGSNSIKEAIDNAGLGKHTQNTDTGTTSATFKMQSGSNGAQLKNVGSDSAATIYVRNYLDNDDAHLVVKNLTVNGTQTIINSETLEIADNIITLNSDVTTGTPTVDAGIEVSRGSETNSAVTWDETNNVWKCGVQGSEITIVRKATASITSWTLDTGKYRADVTHNLGTRPVNVQVYDSSWNQIVPDDIVLTDTNTARIWMPDNTTDVEVIVVG